jgi:antitoxin (DNA-binding transcriptional repressor) of toxin-antitoxin stability system
VKQFAAETLNETLGEFLQALRAGESATITDSGKEVAQVTPIAEPTQPRLGCMAGKIWTAPGWEQPDPEITASFEDSDL